MIPLIWNGQTRQTYREFNRKIHDMERKMDNPGEPSPDFHFVWHLTWGWLKKLERDVGAGIFLSAGPLQESHLTDIVSSSHLSYLVASKRRDDPECHISHMLLIKASQKASPFKERR